MDKALKTVTLLRNRSLFLITPKYRFDKLCLYSITEIVFINDLPNWWRALLTRVGVIKVWMEGSWCFPRLAPKDLRVAVYDPLRGVPAMELKVIKSKDKLRHG